MLDGVEVCWSVAAGDSAHLAELSAAINDAAFDLERFATVFAEECREAPDAAAATVLATAQIADPTGAAAEAAVKTTGVAAADAVTIAPGGGDDEAALVVRSPNDPLLSELLDAAELDRLILHVQTAMAPHYAMHLRVDGADATAAYHVARYLRYLQLLGIMKGSLHIGATRGEAATSLSAALSTHLDETRPIASAAREKKEHALVAVAEVERDLAALESQVHIGPEGEKEQLREFVRLRERLRDSTLFAKGPTGAARRAAEEQGRCLEQLDRIEVHLRQQLANTEGEMQSDLRIEMAALSFADLDARVQRATARLRAMQAAQRRNAEAAEKQRRESSIINSNQRHRRMAAADRRGRISGGDTRRAMSISPRRRRPFAAEPSAEEGAARGDEDLVLQELRARAEREMSTAQEGYAHAHAEYTRARRRARKVEACLVVLQSELTTLEVSATQPASSQTTNRGGGGEGTVQEQMARLAEEAERADTSSEKRAIENASAKLRDQLARQHTLAIAELKRRHGKRMALISEQKSAEYEQRLDELKLQREDKEAKTAALELDIAEKRATLQLAKNMRAEQEQVRSLCSRRERLLFHHTLTPHHLPPPPPPPRALSSSTSSLPPSLQRIDEQMRLAELRGKLRQQWADEECKPEEIKDFLLYVLGFREEDEELALVDDGTFVLPLQRSNELLWRCRLEVRVCCCTRQSLSLSPSPRPHTHACSMLAPPP